METFLSHPSPAVFFGLLTCTLILGVVFVATIVIALRRKGPKVVADGPPSKPTDGSAEVSGLEWLGQLQSAVASLQAQDPGSASYSRQLSQVRMLLDASAARYPASAAKIQAWSQQLRESTGGENRNLLILTEIYGWTRQQTRETV